MKAENQEIEKRKYEIAFVIKTEDASIVLKSLINRGFGILAENPIGKVQLAYPIKKENYAYFSFAHFEGDPAAIKDLKNDLKLNPEVLRYLIITPPFIKKPAWRKSAPTRPQEETKFASPSSTEPILTNEALEKKIEEILK